MPETYSTFWDRLQVLPPILIRLLAKDGKNPMPTSEIVRRSGLSEARVASISWQTNWRGIDVLEMRAFLTGCNRDFVDYAQWKRIRNYINNKAATFKYLRRSPEFEQLLKPLSDAYYEHLQQSVDG